MESPVILTNHPAFMADPFPYYATWRDAGPVHPAVTPDGSSVWLVTRYPDVRAALADPHLSLHKANSRGGYSGFALPPALDANLLNMDPPGHTRIRRLVSKAFTARRVQDLRPAIEQHAAALLKSAHARHGPVDAVADIAAPLSLHILGDLIGVPHEQFSDFRAWAEDLFAPRPGHPDAAQQAVQHMDQMVRTLIAKHRARPADTLLGALIAARDETDRLSEDELTSLAFLILLAGHETTIHLIGNALVALLQHPQQLAFLQSAPAPLVPTAVEELVRYAGPNPYAIRRFPLENMTIGGSRVRVGDTVLLNLASANRDPTAFNAPDELRLDRRDNPHVGFGHGAHYCLGAALARATTNVAIGAMIKRQPTISAAVPLNELRWRGSFRSRGLATLPILIPGP